MKLEEVILRGTRAAQPVAGFDAGEAPPGSVYYVTDESVTERVNDAGTAWEDISDAGTGGAVATDAIWDAAGDLAVGSGANTAARLAVGAANTVPKSNGTTLAYSLMPGHEIYYEEDTSDTNITATVEASADTVIAGAATTFDGTACIIEFVAPAARPDTGAAGRQLIIWLFQDGSSIGRLGIMTAPAAASDSKPIALYRKMTPTAASHTYSIRATVNAGTGVVSAGAGGAGANMPAFLRITKA